MAKEIRMSLAVNVGLRKLSPTYELYLNFNLLICEHKITDLDSSEK